ncbi:outer membrane protein transport protein, partial [Desulfobacterales bacterium HSG17]|nr:outer membrane protein transport protein [Desulfobacterales bacterium HSG17]
MKRIFFLSTTLFICIILTVTVFAEVTPLPANINTGFSPNFAPNPVGSGARALGYSSFIAVADDATAASWNPGALIQLKKSELSIMGSWFYRNEDNTFKEHPEAEGSYNISDFDLNYMSIAYPFRLLDRNIIISLNYQHTFSFSRLSYKFNEQVKNSENNMPIPQLYSFNDIIQQQSGNISAVGLAYSFEIIPRSLSFGFIVNIWDDDLSENNWEQTYGGSTIIENGDVNVAEFSYKVMSKFIFEGYNFNLGVLWRSLDRKLTLGAVYKSKFTGDLMHEFHVKQTGNDPNEIIMKKKLKMPMSYGLGIAYRFSDSFTMASDIYRTHWDEFIIEDDDGTEISSVTAKPVDESDVEPTLHLRMGAEYLFINKNKNHVIPLRGGIFYDPSPAEGNPDNYYGFSIGSGFAKGRYIWDIALQYRFGRNVGDSTNPNYEFS